VRVGGVAADVADDAEVAGGGRERLEVDKGRDGFGEVDAVDEEVALDDLGVGPGAVFCLGQVPLLDLVAADLVEEVDGAAAAAAKGAEDERGGLAAGDLFTCCDVVLELGDELRLVVVVAAAVGEGLDAGEGLAVMCQLPCPCLCVLLVHV
jgi:hypothetical protein